MLKEDFIREFNKYLEENPSNFDKEYLSQIKLEVIDFSKKDDWYNLTYKLHGFNYGSESEEHSTTSTSREAFIWSIYSKIVTGTDLMRKDKRTRELIDRAHEEAIDLINRRNWFKFWNWFKPKEKRNVYIGSCHVFWSEQKRILKEKYNIDWKTPAERSPDVKFD